jgi:hypothetical protein
VAFGSAARAVKTMMAGADYPTAPIAPLFWNGRANDYGFEKPVDATAVHQRRQIRIWKTDMITETDGHVFVGLACLDSGLKWWLAHELNPDLNAAREEVVGNLHRSGSKTDVQKIEFVPPQTGKTSTGERFFTDGYLAVLYITD